MCPSVSENEFAMDSSAVGGGVSTPTQTPSRPSSVPESVVSGTHERLRESQKAQKQQQQQQQQQQHQHQHHQSQPKSSPKNPPPQPQSHSQQQQQQQHNHRYNDDFYHDFPPTSSRLPPSQGHGQSYHDQHIYGQPATGVARGATFTSPRADNAAAPGSSPYQVLARLMKSTDPAIVRHVIRDIHEVTLLGSEYHHAFLLNACFHQASPTTLDASVQRFGGKLVSSSLRSLLLHMTHDLLDSVSDLLLSKLSNDFLDKALDKRLSTIRARSLVNALAKAERLGYDGRDVVVEGRDGSEHVIPHQKPNLAQGPAAQMYQPQVPVPQNFHPHMVDSHDPRVASPAAGQPRESIKAQNVLHCSTCARPCTGAHALRYHKHKKNCNQLGTFNRIARSICAHCGTIFSNGTGLVYHTKSQVCGQYSHEDLELILPWLAKFYRERDRAAGWLPAHGDQRLPLSSQMPAQSGFTPVNASPSGSPQSQQSLRISQAYAHLSPGDRANFDAAIKKAEDKYSEEMQRVLANTDLTKSERELELVKLKNRFNTKQSITRKKYGIRLRERRPKTEIEAERHRILLSTSRTADSTAPMDSTGEPASKKPRLSMGAPSSQACASVNSSPAAYVPQRATMGEASGLGNSAGTSQDVDPTVSSSSSAAAAAAVSALAAAASEQSSEKAPAAAVSETWPEKAPEASTSETPSEKASAVAASETPSEKTSAVAASETSPEQAPPAATEPPRVSEKADAIGPSGTAEDDPMVIDDLNADTDSDNTGVGDADDISILSQS